jgi:uncharacterized protein (DUF1499 family)
LRLKLERMAAAPSGDARRQPGERRRRVAKVTTLALVLAIAAALAGLAAGPAYRFGLLSLESAFGLLRIAAYGGIGVALLALIGVVLARPGGPRRGFYRALAAFVIGVVVVGVPWSYLWKARSVPPIHDVTTDTENPPQFLAVRPLRADDPNSASYGGPEVAAQQQEAYPDIETLRLDLPPDQAFQRALQAAQAMGWEIVRADYPARRIEATDQTFWFGFKDDVVIRVRPAESGSRIDMRSTSRVGQSDLGVNAERIRSYLGKLEELSRA